MDSMADESVSNDSTEEYYSATKYAPPKLFPSAEAVVGIPLKVSLEKFITLCRTRLEDPPNRRKKRYSGLRKTVCRFNHSYYWNPIVFHEIITKFHKKMESDGTDHESAEAIFKDLLKEVTIASGHVSCSGKCRKRKKKSRKEPTVNKLEKSLAVVQRRINRLKDESSTNAWEVRDGRDGRCLKLHGMQKKAIRLTKKINELSKLASAALSANASSVKPVSNEEASGIGGEGGGDGVGSGNSSSSGFNSNSDMDELNCLLKSVRLKESVKIKPKEVYRFVPIRLRTAKASDTPRRSVYPRIEMVEIKKYDQQNQCYVEPSTSSKSMPFKIVRWKGQETNPSSTCNPPSLASSPSDTSKAHDLIYVNNKSPTKKRTELKINTNKLRKQSTFDLICDRFRHVKLNS